MIEDKKEDILKEIEELNAYLKKTEQSMISQPGKIMEIEKKITELRTIMDSEEKD